MVRTKAIEDLLKTLNNDTTPEPESDLNKITPLKPAIKRANNFNSCFSEVIAGFIDRNDYPPTLGAVLHELHHKPPTGYIINFNGDTLSIDGAKPKTLDNVKRTINALLSKV